MSSRSQVKVMLNKVKSKAPKIKEVELNYGSVEAQIKYIQGKVLTIIDASYGDAVQRKAIKDIVNNYFSDSLNWLYDLSHEGIQSLSETQMVQVDTNIPEESIIK